MTIPAPIPNRRAEVCIDAGCGFCLRAGRLLRRWLAWHGIALRALQAPDVARRLGLTDGAAGEEFKLIRADGAVFGGASAAWEALRLAQWPLPSLSLLPGLRRALDAAYRYAAGRWHCRDACPARRRPRAAPGALRVLVEALHGGLNDRRRRAAL
jgi:predicted DCC family thiol-disulfide oxidoreductase YuxK